MADPNTAKELNRLYWESDASVADIADRLDISRRALYDGIEPRPAGRPCPECGAPLGFRNRTALANREAECLECGLATELEAGPGPAARRAGAAPDAAGDRPPEGPLGRPRSLPTAGSGPILGLAFLAGLTLGALASYLFFKPR